MFELNQPSTPLSKIQKIRIQTDASGCLSWLFPAPLTSDKVPVIQVTVEPYLDDIDDFFFKKIMMVNNTGCCIKVYKSSPVLVKGVNCLGAPIGYQCYLHIIATEV